MDFYVKKSEEMAHITINQVNEFMLDENPAVISRHIEKLQKDVNAAVGVVGPDGKPAFKTTLLAPPGAVGAKEMKTFLSEDTLVFFKPMANEERCHRCHSPSESTRGAVIVKTSLTEALKEIEGTERRLLYYGLMLGVLSEFFLVVIIRRLVIKPLGALRKGAEDVREGRFGLKVDIKTGDEIQYLAETFNTMAQEIESSQKRLEKAVLQKTKELKTVAGLAAEVLKGDPGMKEVAEHFLEALTKEIGCSYAALCLLDKETGLLLTEYKKGIENSFCGLQIPLTSDHPFAKTIREVRPSIKKSEEIDLPEKFGRIVIVPLLTRRRKRCREFLSCTQTECPAFGGAEERCWLVKDTLCRSPIALQGKDKIYGCVHCEVFPVMGVLIAGKTEEMDETSIHSLEIMASEIASALESRRLIDEKKQDIRDLIKLHEISVEKIQKLDMKSLFESIVDSATVFAGMDAAVLYLEGEGGLLRLAGASDMPEHSGPAESLIPKSLPVEGSFVGKSILEDRPIETTRVSKDEHFAPLSERHGIKYMASIPLKFKWKTEGCLTLFKKRDFLMTDSEKAVIMLLASQFAAALNTARLYESLKEEKEFSDAVFNNMGTGIMVLDAEGAVVRLNRFGADILGAPPETLIGKRLSRALPGAERLLEKDISPTKEMELSIGGRTIPLGFHNSPLFDAEGHTSATVVIFRDLTEIKRLQAEIRKKQHFESMGRVVAGVAHEIRNPLFGISFIAQILERETTEDKHKALLQALLKETNRMKRLVEELLLYSRPSKLNIVEAGLDIFVEKIRDFIKAKGKPVSLAAYLQDSPTLKADVDKMTQVFINLTDNAMGSGAACIEIRSERKGGLLLISISDDGSGISAEHMERVFDPFFTTRKEGTGLGLSICKKLVEDHGGKIDIESTAGKGTTVRLSFGG